MKSLPGLAAGVCALLSAAAFAAGVWIERRGDAKPGPLDLLWVEAASGPETLPDPAALGLAPGDRWRVARRAKDGSWSLQDLFPAPEKQDSRALPSLESLHAEGLASAKPVWVCRVDRDLPDFIARPQGATLAFLPRIEEAPKGWEFLGVSMPSAARAGRPFLLQWKLGSVGGAAGRARVWIDGAQAGETSFTVAGREERASLAVTVATPGAHAFRIEAMEGSAAGRPREITGSLEALPPPRMRLVGEGNDVARWLETQGFVRESAKDSSELPDLILVTRALSSLEVEALEALVREGAGLVFFQGDAFTSAKGGALPDWFPAKGRPNPLGSSSDGPAASAPNPAAGPDATNPAPPSPPPEGEISAPRKETKESSVLALMLVLDKSGSMAGEKLERTIEAAIETAKTLDPKDLLGILAFDREVTELLPLGPASGAGDLRARFEKLDAGGGTRIFPALKRGADILTAAPASIRHLILLTDGATEDKVAKDAPYFEFMAEQARKGLTLTAVGIRGGDYDSEFLSNLAVWGKGRFYPVDSDRIPQIFTLEAKRVRSMAGATPSLPSSNPQSEWRVRSKDPHPILQGIDWEKPQAAPPLRAMFEMSPQPWAALPLTAGGSPLLAISHVGKGRVAQWASAGSGPAIGEWMSEERARQLWLQSAEYLRRRDPAVKGDGALQAKGLDLENRLRSREDRMREIGQMSARCGGDLLEDEGEIPTLLRRQSLRAVPSSLPWFALAGAAFALLAMIFSTLFRSPR